jgi:hypothetical protein
MKKSTLRDRLAVLSQDFSPVLAARVLEGKARRIMRGKQSFKYRLNQLVSLDARHGQVWPVSVGASWLGAALSDTATHNTRAVCVWGLAARQC